MRLALGIVLLAAASLSCDPDTYRVQVASGVQGRVTASPVCPVETDPPQPGCDPVPLEGAVIEVRTQAGQIVTRVASSEIGQYAIALAPGNYSLQSLPFPAHSLPAPPAPVAVEVPDETWVTVDLDYDTGIR